MDPCMIHVQLSHKHIYVYPKISADVSGCAESSGGFKRGPHLPKKIKILSKHLYLFLFRIIFIPHARKFINNSVMPHRPFPLNPPLKSSRWRIIFFEKGSRFFGFSLKKNWRACPLERGFTYIQRPPSTLAPLTPRSLSSERLFIIIGEPCSSDPSTSE